MNGELPMISKSVGYATSMYEPDAQFQTQHAARAVAPMHDLQRRVSAINAGDLVTGQAFFKQEQEQMANVRIVRVFIVDPNENLPLDKRVLYQSDEKLTDMTDQELFFDANPAALLAKHNEYRTTVVDKKLATLQGMDRGSVLLEPARIRDLKMAVVDVAKF